MHAPDVCNYLWDHVAKWIGHFTQDQKVWDSIPAGGHVQKCWESFSFHTASTYPVVMGTW